MASSTSSHGSSKSVPSTFSKAAVDHLDLVGPQGPHVAVVVAEEALGVDGEHALAALLVGRRRAVDHRPGRPRGWRRAARPAGGAGSRTGVTDAAPWRCAVPRQSAPVSPPPMMMTCLPLARDGHVLDGEVALLHAGWTTAGTPSPGGCRPSSRPGIGRSRQAVAPPGQHDGVELLAQLVDGDVDADVHAGAELGALGLHLLEAAVEVALLHLELGDAVAQQAADAVGPLEHHDVVAGPGELLGGGQAPPGRSRRRPPACRSAPTAAAPARPSPRPRPGR